MKGGSKSSSVNRDEACLRECKEEPEGVAKGRDGVGAYASMSHEPIGEPPLDQHGQMFEALLSEPPTVHPAVAPAWVISSGAADRYQ